MNSTHPGQGGFVCQKKKKVVERCVRRKRAREEEPGYRLQHKAADGRLLAVDLRARDDFSESYFKR